MRKCVSQQQMKDMEYDSIANVGIPSIVLMERAALAVAQHVKKDVAKEKYIAIVCGMGNNGADGIAVARHLHQIGYDVCVVTVGDQEKATEEYKIQEHIMENMKIASIPWEDWTPNSDMCIIDGIFGIGLTRPVSGEYGELIDKIQKSGCKHIIAIDVPSGISGDTGEVLGIALKATDTITFGYEKQGMYLNEGPNYCGNIHVADIGFHKDSIGSIKGNPAMILEEEDMSYIPQRQESAHKGTYGKLLVIAGSSGMSGAAYLCAMAAYRMGAGLVKILTVEENRQILQAQLPEAIVQCYSEVNMSQQIKEGCQWATTIIMGPGLGQDSYVHDLVQSVLEEVNQKEEKCSLVLDSDALNTLAKNPNMNCYLDEHVVITPHMKEMSRLIQSDVATIKANPIMWAQNYSEKHNLICALKDSTTVITDNKQQIYFTVSGNSALAKGGSGDVLAGMIGGLMCIGLGEMESAAWASYLHGRAGSLVSRERGKHGVVARELLEYMKI